MQTDERTTAPASFLPDPITIDLEFDALLPALKPYEHALLEHSILLEGCRDPLAVWAVDRKLLLLDGHARYNICKKHGLPFTTKEITLASRDHALLWIEENQLCRSNLNDDQSIALLGDLQDSGAFTAEKFNGILNGVAPQAVTA
ncbi:MAG: hypothetical protein LAO78_23770 [Acidobacteriia bacterium]|nr:hypothetical protein [Terriglobia bacterium]